MKKIIILASILLTACSASNVEDIKEHAPKIWNDAGFDIVMYEGYQWTGFGQWGGCVWYIVEKQNTNYHGCISKWENEYQLWSMTAIDAIKGN